jgi:hypothetical protein
MTPEQVKLFIEEALRGGIWFPWWLYVIAGVCTFLGAFLGAYAKRKGENWATKEDFKIVIQQLQATTSLTESIKSDIARVSWVDQKRWELKRDLYSMLLEGLYEEKSALVRLAKEEKGSVVAPEFANLKELIIKEKHMQSQEALKKIKKALALAHLVLDEEAIKALEELASKWDKSLGEGVENFYTQRLEAVTNTHSKVVQAAIEDLKTQRKEP